MQQSTAVDPFELPQADASTLVDRSELERQVQDVYRSVADDPSAPRHFETGRALARRLGYPETLLAGAIPHSAYLEELEGAGFTITARRPNDYLFVSDRALGACRAYGVESVTIAASRNA